ILWGYEAIREALVDQAEAFSGLGLASGMSGKVLRRFSVMIMKDLGMGKRSTEERIKEEAQCLVEELRKSQEEVQAEIDRVICARRLPALEDWANVPYTGAIIHEIQRFSDSVPLGLPRSVIRDTHFRGYYLPKGVTVYPILSSALHDPRRFEKPDAFYPVHFLDMPGKFKKPQAFIPFCISKPCSSSPRGMSLFLIFTSLLQNFSLGSPKAPEDTDLTPRVNGLGRLPPVFQVSFLPCRGWGRQEEAQIPSESLHAAPLSVQN
uniref:Uncharacterized protein n=1 Tax=Moschus moschiferus TaxID=68415 RepID=A0A8C6EBE4_MOSMO